MAPRRNRARPARPDPSNPPLHVGGGVGGVLVNVVPAPNEVDPTKSDLWVEIEKPEWEWTIAYRVVPGEGVLAISEVRVFPQQKVWYTKRWPGTFEPSTTVPVGGLARRWLRDNVATDGHLEHARFYLEQILEPLSDESAYMRKLMAGIRSLGFTALEVGEQGQRGKSLLWWARLCAAYVDLIEQGSKRPIVDMAERFDMEPSAVRDYLHRARHKNEGRPQLLTQLAPGRAGGKLTPDAEQILRAADKKAPRAKGTK